MGGESVRFTSFKYIKSSGNKVRSLSHLPQAKRNRKPCPWHTTYRITARLMFYITRHCFCNQNESSLTEAFVVLRLPYRAYLKMAWFQEIKELRQIISAVACVFGGHSTYCFSEAKYLIWHHAINLEPARFFAEYGIRTLNYCVVTDHCIFQGLFKETNLYQSVLKQRFCRKKCVILFARRWHVFWLHSWHPIHYFSYWCQRSVISGSWTLDWLLQVDWSEEMLGEKFPHKELFLPIKWI